MTWSVREHPHWLVEEVNESADAVIGQSCMRDASFTGHRRQILPK